MCNGDLCNGDLDSGFRRKDEGQAGRTHDVVVTPANASVQARRSRRIICTCVVLLRYS
jgi:hypothetical protein